MILRHLGQNASGLLILLVINIVIGFLPGMNWAWQAHVGGLIGGAVLGLIYARTRAPAQRRLQNVLVIAVAALEVIAALAHAPIFVM
ncbi:unannotated protein [freshwater metagenome]|uniref:Unannotated protein n=1 Tax=freshwater metagenome TaxID=449393 RepID=A0A6J7GME8_9ZZZZ